jgi:hypothetical protein
MIEADRHDDLCMKVFVAIRLLFMTIESSRSVLSIVDASCTDGEDAYQVN